MYQIFFYYVFLIINGTIREQDLYMRHRIAIDILLYLLLILCLYHNLFHIYGEKEKLKRRNFICCKYFFTAEVIFSQVIYIYPIQKLYYFIFSLKLIFWQKII